MLPGDRVSRDQLLELAAPYVPEGMDREEVVAGIGMALTPPSDLTLPVQRDLLRKDVVYAWREEDASATKLALDVLGHLWSAAMAGSGSIVNLGVAIKELVAFLVTLHRQRVRIDDPLKIAVLLRLRESSGGLTVPQIVERVRGLKPGEKPPTAAEVKAALKALESEPAKSGPKALVRFDGLIWKSLV